jgi:hypothetical protein
MAEGTEAPAMPPQEDHSKDLPVVWWTFFAIATAFIVLRVWARYIRRTWGADDITMFFCWLFFMAEAILLDYMARSGRTQHILWLFAQGGRDLVERTMTLWFIVLTIGIFLTGLGKVAIGITILRIIGNTSKWQRWAVWITIVLTIVTCVMDVFITLFRCGSPKHMGAVEIRPGVSCVNDDVHNNLNIFANAIQVIADFAFSILPMFVVHNLRIARRRKWFLMIALGMTMMTGVAGVMKSIHAANLHHGDFPYEVYTTLVWFGIESMLICVCGTAPCLASLYDRFIKRHNLGYGSQDKMSNKYWTRSSNAQSGLNTVSSRTTKRATQHGDMFHDSLYRVNDEEELHHGKVQSPSTVELVQLTHSQPIATTVTAADTGAEGRAGRIEVTREIAVSTTRGGRAI